MAANGDQERNERPQPQGNPAGGGGFTMSGKMLGIAGGGAVALVVVIVVVVLLVTGVFGGGGGGASGGGDWLDYVPGDAAGVSVTDSRAFYGGDVPEDLVEYLEDGRVSVEAHDFLDVDGDDLIIHAGVFDNGFDVALEILRGNFDFDIIREELEDGRDCEDDDYRSFELWECPGEEYPAVALFEKDKYVVLAAQRQGDLEGLLTYKSREPEKLASAAGGDIKRLLGQTRGWFQLVVIGEACLINRCEGLAFALEKSDDSAEMPASYALLFSSERAATAAEGEIEIDDLLEEWFASLDLDLNIGEVKADGEFLVGDGTAEFVDPDDASSRSSNQNGGSVSGRGSETVRAQAATEPPLPTRIPSQGQVPAMAAPAQGQQQAPRTGAIERDLWVGDCSHDLMRQLNPRLPRHQQISEADAYDRCECLYAYIEEWEEPPTLSYSDIMSVRGGSMETVDLLRVLTDAHSYCRPPIRLGN